MERISHVPVRVAAFEAHTMSDAALVRLARGASEVVAVTSAAGNDLAARWAVLLPKTPLIDGGFVRNLREAMVEAAKRGIGQIAIATPRDVPRTVGFALQGAASAAEHDVPAMSVRIMRNADGGTGIALFTDTGEPSGYATLFALGLAELEGADLTTLVVRHGARLRRGPDGLTKMIAAAEPSRVAVTERTVASPLEVVLAEDFSVVVHAVLDVRVGGDLLGNQELGARTFEGDNLRDLLRLVDEFKGDIELVLDGVRLLHGRRRAQRTAASVGMEFGALAGAGFVPDEALTVPTPASPEAPVDVIVDDHITIPELVDEVPAADGYMPVTGSVPRVSAPSSALRYPDQVVVRVEDAHTVLVTNPTREPLRVLHLVTTSADGGPGTDAARELATVPIGRVDQPISVPTASDGVESQAIAVETADEAFSMSLVAASEAFAPGEIAHSHVPAALLPERPVASPQPRYVEREVVEPSNFVVPGLADAATEGSVAVGEHDAGLVPEPVEIVQNEPEPVSVAEAEPEPLPEPEPVAVVEPEPQPEREPEPEPVAVVEPEPHDAAAPVPIPPGATFDPLGEPELPLPTPPEGTRMPGAAPVAAVPPEETTMPAAPPVAVPPERVGQEPRLSRRERRHAREAAELQHLRRVEQEA